MAQSSSTTAENAPNKPVHLIYLCGAVLAFYLLQWTIDWVWGYFTVLGPVPNELTLSIASGFIAVIGAIVLYRNDRVYTYANEVAGELKKVTWPTAKEVRAATFVVIVMAIISAIILGLFDLVWSKLTDMVYGGV